MSDCIFCNIIAGKIDTDFVYEDDQVVVFNDIRPKANVHLLVVPRTHIISLAELEADHQNLMGYCLCLLPKLAKDQGLDTGFRTIINTGRGGGQEVDHIHFHLLGGVGLPGF